MNPSVTMSSLELVVFINDSRQAGEAELTHADFLKKVPKVLTIDGGKFSSVYLGKNGQERPCYNFPKREACLMAMSYSYDLQAKVFDRMTALEALQTPRFQVPHTLAGALRLAAEQAEAIEQQSKLIEQQKPAVEFVEKYVDAKTTKCISDVAKLLKVGRDAFFKFLSDEKIIFKRGNTWLPFRTYDQYFEVKADEVNGIAIMTTKFNAKGISWIAGRYAVKTIQQKVLL